MSIYADMVLLINFIMNSCLLVLTAYAAGISFSWKRLFMTAAVGSMYTLGGIFPAMAVFYGVLGKLSASVVMIVLAFGYRSAKITALLTGVFFMMSFLVGGALLGWVYFVQTQASYGVSNNIKLSLENLLLGSIMAISLISVLVQQLMARMHKQRSLYQARISYDGRSQEFIGMLDTGNGLYSLLGGTPVVLLALQTAIQLLGPQAAEFLSANSSDTWLANLDKCQDSVWLAKVEIIPCQSVGGRNMLLGFRPDSITVVTKEGLTYTAEVIIGICDNIFSDTSECQALLHPAIMTDTKITGEAH